MNNEGPPPGGRFCLQCTYPLHGITEPRCPECGRSFDPADRSTYARRPGDRTWRSRARPPSPPFLVATLLLAGWAVYDLSLPGFPGYAIVAAGFWILLALVADYAVRVGAVWLDRVRARRDGQTARPYARIGWWLLPGCLLAVVILAATHTPLRLRFHVSRPALDRMTGEFRAEGAGVSSRAAARQVGLYRVRRVFEHGEGNVAFRVRNSFSLGDRVQCAGFEHRVHPPAVGEGYAFVRPLGGDWYAVGW